MTQAGKPRVPSSARVVVIGGGIMGCSIAYHLAHEGWRDIVLLEKSELTSGSTWHAAGQITHSTTSFSLGKCVDYNIRLYSGALQLETGHSVTWHGCGSLRVAYSEDEMDWLRHTLSIGRSLGFNLELVPPSRIAELHPFYQLDGVLGALHTPDDGHVDPAGICQAIAAGARALGTRIIRRCRATNLSRRATGEWCVETENGRIICEHIVNAGGCYARQIGDWSGLQLPMASMTHHYIVTDSVPEFGDLERELPVVRDDRKVSGYIRMEQRSGLIGIYEKANPNVVWEEDCPWDAENELFEADFERIMPWLENALDRMPVLSTVGIKRTVHGAISHPPDGNPLVGPVPGASNYWCCCGTQIGVGWGPGLTRELARWMVHGAADISMREFDPRRFGGYANRDWQAVKAKEDYCLRHEIPFPHLNRTAGRPIKPSPLYRQLHESGAVFEEVYGHERPRWFARNGVEQSDHYSFRRNIVHDLVGSEVKAVREAAGIMDITAFTKIEVSGPDAGRFLDRIIANRVPARVGGIVLTHMLNHRGRVEIELTVARLSEHHLYLTCAAFFEQRLLDHLNQHRDGEEVIISNRSGELAAIALQGPKSRKVLAENADADLSNAAFRWFTVQEIAIAGKKMRALRMSYVGELGWEIHGPREHIPAVYEALRNSGRQYRIVDYGSFAMNAMRMEKMFKGASELTNEVTLPEADVMRFVRLDKARFVGKAATEASSKGKIPWICAYLAIESDGVHDGQGGEPVLLEGELVGSTTSVAFGHAVGKILAFAYVNPVAAEPGTVLQVLIAGESRDAVVLGEPAYDPENARPRMDAE